MRVYQTIVIKHIQILFSWKWSLNEQIFSQVW